jgi:hypothetical protein
MTKPSTGLAERKKTCEVAIALYSRISDLQDPDNAYVMRYVLSAK